MYKTQQNDVLIVIYETQSIDVLIVIFKTQRIDAHMRYVVHYGTES